MKKLLVVLFAVAVLAGCGTIPHQVRTDVVHDLTLGTITIETVNLRYSDAPFKLGVTWSDQDIINLERITSKRGVTYRLVVEYRGEEWRFMDGPIKLAIGDQAMTLETDSPNRDVGRGYVTEILRATVPPENVEELFASDNIEIQYWGEPIKLTEEEISYLRMLSPQKPK